MTGPPGSESGDSSCDPGDCADGESPQSTGDADETDGPDDRRPDDRDPDCRDSDDRDPNADAGDGEYAHEAVYEFDYAAADRARRVAAAVGREVGEIDDDRSRATLDRTDRRVTVAVRARDLVALRAATNTWLGLVDVAERTIRVADEG